MAPLPLMNLSKRYGNTPLGYAIVASDDDDDRQGSGGDEDYAPLMSQASEGLEFLLRAAGKSQGDGNEGASQSDISISCACTALENSTPPQTQRARCSEPLAASGSGRGHSCEILLEDGYVRDRT
jgi:hypothetical protein